MKRNCLACGEEFLFSVSLDLQKDLDGGVVPKVLAKKFEEAESKLSPQA